MGFIGNAALCFSFDSLGICLRTRSRLFYIGFVIGIFLGIFLIQEIIRKDDKSGVE